MLLTRGSLNGLLSLSIAGCLAVYALTWLTRPSVPDSLRAGDPWRYGFPSWYDKVAEEPVDTAALAVLRDRKIVVVGNPDDLSSSQSSFVQYLSEGNHGVPGMEVRWDSDSQDALHSAGCYYDVVWTMGGTVQQRSPACHALWLHEDGEGQPGRLAPERITDRVAPNMTITSSQLSLAKAANYGSMEAHPLASPARMGMLAHVPPSIDLSIFHPKRKWLPWLNKRKVTYFTSEGLPRTAPRWWHVHRDAQPVRSRPDWPRFWQTRPLTTAERLDQRRKADKVRAEAMRSSWICIFDDWESGDLTSRTIQAMASGCVVAAVPSAMNNDVRNFVIPIRAAELPLDAQGLHSHRLDRMRYAEQALEPFLRPLDKAELSKASLMGLHHARHLGHSSKVQRIASLLARFYAGERGFLFSHGFSADCQSGDHLATAPWCQK